MLGRVGVVDFVSGFLTRHCGCMGVECSGVLSGEGEGDSVMLVFGKGEVGVVLGKEVAPASIRIGGPVWRTSEQREKSRGSCP